MRRIAGKPQCECGAKFADSTSRQPQSGGRLTSGFGCIAKKTFANRCPGLILRGALQPSALPRQIDAAFR